MKSVLTFILTICAIAVAQPPKTDVLTLGTFHFNFPNLDVAQVGKHDQIDVLSPPYQKEIAAIVDNIARFKPTVIVIERQPNQQARTDSAYARYVLNQYSLKRNEEEQIGFRLARQLGLKKLYCVDEWGNFNARLDSIVYGKDKVEAQKFDAFFESKPDSSKRFHETPNFKSTGILAALRQLNDEQNLKKSLGNYLIGLFKYESKDRDFTGVDFETGRWFSRNLKIFRNIQRIPVRSTDRILVLYGAGHMNLLNYIFDCSPEFSRVKTTDYLR